MKRIMVRYKLLAGRSDENLALLSEVYRELRAAAPEGLRYATLCEDAASFVHLASIETADDSNPLTKLAAFNKFGENIKERCEEPPRALPLTLVDSYRMFGGNAEVVYEDNWGSIINRPERAISEIRWFDSTVAMTSEAFQSFLLRFAASLEARPGRGALVDATAFKMDRKLMSAEWRDANVIPRYNAARVRKFAFHVPTGAPMLAGAPAREKPGEFLTGYFPSRAEALAWLAEA